MRVRLAVGKRSLPNPTAVVSQVRSYSREILGHGDIGPALGSLAYIGQFEQRLASCRRSRFDQIQVHQRSVGSQRTGTQLLELLFGRNQLFFQVLDLSAIRSECGFFLRFSIFFLLLLFLNQQGQSAGWHELDRRHASVCLFGELTSHLAVGTFRTAGRFGGIALGPGTSV